MAGYKVPKYNRQYSAGPFNSYLWTQVWRSPLGIVIAINIQVFIILGVIKVASGYELTPYVALLSPWSSCIHRPWGFLTYMFVQADFLNLLFNMLWLFAFGSLLIRLDRPASFIRCYIIGGIAGGLLFIGAASVFFNSHSLLIGSSAAILSVITYTAIKYPRTELNLMLLGNVRLIWIALIAVMLCGLAPGLGNTPTLLAHIGGIIGGCLTAILFSPNIKSKLRFVPPKVEPKHLNVRTQERRGLSSDEQTELDSLLERVQRSGYKSLNSEERKRLFLLSTKIK